MPWTGMRSLTGTGGALVVAVVVVVAMSEMIPLFQRAINTGSLRRWHTSGAYGRHRPENRCVASPERAQIVQGHRLARRPDRPGGEAARGPARGERGDPRLHRDGRSACIRMARGGVRGPLLRGPHAGRLDQAGGRGGGGRGVSPHGRGRGERASPRDGPRHPGPRAVPGADPRNGRHQPHRHRGGALDPVRTLGAQFASSENVPSWSVLSIVPSSLASISRVVTSRSSPGQVTSAPMATVANLSRSSGLRTLVLRDTDAATGTNGRSMQY